MPGFDSLEDAQRVTTAAWDGVIRRRAMSRIDHDEIDVGWRPNLQSTMMSSWIYGDWTFEGDLDALRDWWLDFGDGYIFLPPQLKPRGNWAVNLQYFPPDPYQLPFNFHLTVPAEDIA